MIRRLAWWVIPLALVVWLAGSALADTFKLIDGSELAGDPIAFGRDGLAVKKADGSFSPKVGWTNFTQEALKQLSAIPRAKAFVDPYLEPEEPQSSKKVAPEIKPKPVTRFDRPDPKAGFGAIFSSSLSVTLLLILYLANIYAGYEISIFRNYPAGMVCGVAAVVPVAGPLLFLCLPTSMPKTEAAPDEQVEQESAVPGDQAPVFDAGAAAAPAAPAAPASTHPQATIYKRGQTTFNRRFFETKFSGFLRVVPADAEKDLVILIRSSRGEHVSNRITRIQPNELYLQVTKGGASSDVIIPFNEISEVHVRHKDA